MVGEGGAFAIILWQQWFYFLCTKRPHCRVAGLRFHFTTRPIRVSYPYSHRFVADTVYDGVDYTFKHNFYFSLTSYNNKHFLIDIPGHRHPRYTEINRVNTNATDELKLCRPRYKVTRTYK